MSDIKQFQMRFNPKEDRILFRINTTDASEFQFWLTRRYIKLLWQVLIDLLSKDEKVLLQQSELAKKEILSFQQEAATQKMDMSQSYQTQTGQQPLGSTPILLEKISVKKRADGVQLLCMHPGTGQGIDLALNQTLLHTICKLIQDCVIKANWEIDFELTLNTPASVADIKPRVIN